MAMSMFLDLHSVGVLIQYSNSVFSIHRRKSPRRLKSSSLWTGYRSWNLGEVSSIQKFHKEHSIFSFKSNFVVETKGAGAGQLTVRVRGPKGAFNVEMQRDRQQERTIHCKYEPREPGDYQVEVRWHGQHVLGSPFTVLIVDTEQELQRFLAGGAPSPPPPSVFVPPGWVGPAPPPLAMTGPPMAHSPYGPIPIGMPPQIKGVRRGPPMHPQPIYGRGPRPRY
jgi:hypothetical protein